MQARASIVIARHPAEVFRFIADPANDHLWRAHLVSSRGQVTAVGDRVTQTYSAQAGSKTIELEVSEYQPPERLAYRLKEPVRARLAFQCRPDAGGTRVSMALSAEVSGIVSLAEGRVESVVEKAARADLEQLRRALESMG